MHLQDIGCFGAIEQLSIGLADENLRECFIHPWTEGSKWFKCNAIEYKAAPIEVIRMPRLCCS
jgi:hypothetical protein